MKSSERKTRGGTTQGQQTAEHGPRFERLDQRLMMSGDPALILCDPALLDVPVDQVVIEVQIAEAQRSELRELGISFTDTDQTTPGNPDDGQPGDEDNEGDDNKPNDENGAGGDNQSSQGAGNSDSSGNEKESADGSTSDSENGPILSDIPVIGTLFRGNRPGDGAAQQNNNGPQLGKQPVINHLFRGNGLNNGLNKNAAQQNNGPLLSKIPVIKKLFKSSDDSSETSELLIFITPRIQKSE